MATKEEIRAGHRAGRAALTRAGLESAGAAIARHGLAWAADLSGGKPGTFAAYLGVGVRAADAAAADGAACGRAPRAASGLRTRTGAELGVLDAGLRIRPEPLRTDPGARRGTPRHNRHACTPPASSCRPPPSTSPATGSVKAAATTTSSWRRWPPSCRPGAWRPTAGCCRPVPTAAVVYDAEVLPAGSIPAESFDRKVAAALTPGGLLRLQPIAHRGRAAGVIELALRPCDC